MRTEEGPRETPSVGDRKRWTQTDTWRESSHLGGCALRAWRQGPLQQEVGVLLLLLLSSPTLRQSLRSMSGGFKYNSPCTGILFWAPNKHKRGFKTCQACTWPCAVGSSVPDQAWPYHPPRCPQHRAGAPPLKAKRILQYLPQAKFGGNFINHLSLWVFKKLQAILCTNLWGY